MKQKRSGLATFSVQGEFYSEVGQLIQMDFKEKQIQIGKEKSNLQMQNQEQVGTNLQSNNTTLQVMRLDQEGLIPSFEKDIQQYYLTIPSNIQNIEILAISENPKAIIQITGNTNLQEGLNLITIEVISEDKTRKHLLYH